MKYLIAIFIISMFMFSFASAEIKSLNIPSGTDAIPLLLGTAGLTRMGIEGDGTVNIYNNLNVVGSSNLTSNVMVGGNFSLENTQWDDMTIPLVLGKTTGVNVPSFDTFIDGTMAYSFIADDKIYVIQQMSHSYKLNSTIYQHVHMTPSSTNTGNVTICVEYTKADIGQPFPNTVTSCGTKYMNGTNYNHELNMAGNIGNFTGLSGIINARIYRNATTIGSAYPDKVFILTYDLHYEKDGFGSNEELIK
jgi:hypothetical protein